MSTDYGRRLSSIASNTLDLLSINPFADETVSPSTTVTRPNEDVSWNADARRRSLDTSERSNNPASRKHARSRTEFDIRPSGSSVHPLRSAGLALGPSDAGITRPHLNRILNVGILVDAPPVEETGLPVTLIKETDVFVHNVSPKDSLAGVSLRYGIPMADLRRANHLWSSDSIHLRTELYIPVDKASRLKPTLTDSLISITPEEEVPDPMDSDTNTTHVEDLQYSPQRPSDAETVRRVPASRLSFFPPPSMSKPALVIQSPDTHAPSFSGSTAHYSRYTTLPSNSLTSILTSLPIAASTRDTIIARLSFDSVSSSYSDRGEEGDSHELDDVHHTSLSTLRNAHDTVESSVSPVTPKASHRTPRLGVLEHRSLSPSPVMHVRHLSSSPQSYIPPHTQIRTVQMEPSPGMKLPPLKSSLSFTGERATTHSNIMDVDIELESTA